MREMGKEREEGKRTGMSRQRAAIVRVQEECGRRPVLGRLAEQEQIKERRGGQVEWVQALIPPAGWTTQEQLAALSLRLDSKAASQEEKRERERFCFDSVTMKSIIFVSC